MLENIWFSASFWMGLAFLASLLSIRLGISVALVEILVGVTVGNLVVGHSDHSERWGRLLGDTADRVCDHAHCCVLIAKE